MTQIKAVHVQTTAITKHGPRVINPAQQAAELRKANGPQPAPTKAKLIIDPNKLKKSGYPE